MSSPKFKAGDKAYFVAENWKVKLVNITGVLARPNRKTLYENDYHSHRSNCTEELLVSVEVYESPLFKALNEIVAEDSD